MWTRSGERLHMWIGIGGGAHVVEAGPANSLFNLDDYVHTFLIIAHKKSRHDFFNHVTTFLIYFSATAGAAAAVTVILPSLIRASSAVTSG